MKYYGCCGCGKSTDKEILDNNKGCCCVSCLDSYKETDQYKEVEGLNK